MLIEKYVIEMLKVFKKELDEEIKQMIKEANQRKVKNIWDLKKEEGEEYYFLWPGGSVDCHTFNSRGDEVCREVGNAFLTREEAEFELERRKIEAIMRKYSRPFKNGECNYIVVCDTEDNMTFIRVAQFHYSGGPVFASEEIAQKVIDEIGEERLIKYWFRIKE